MIRAVTFDLWGTLILNPEGYEHRVQALREELLYKALKGKVSRETIAEASDKAWSEILSIRATLRDIPVFHQIKILKKYLKVDTELEGPYTEAILYEMPVLNPYAREVLTHLQTKIGLISNTGRTPGVVLRTVMDRLGILEGFLALLFSNEVGYLKPHPEIFKKASQALRVPLSEIVHVGDDEKTDIEGAQNAGMQALLVEDPADLRKIFEVMP